MKNFRKYISLLMAAVILTCAFSFLNITASATADTPINVVYSDNFSADALSEDWVYMAEGVATDDGNSYTSEIEDGLLKVNTHKLGRSSIAGCMYLPGKETVNQRVAVETSALQNGDTISVYARLTKSDETNWKSLKGYYARYCTSNGKIQLFKIDTASNNVMVIDCGYRQYKSGENFRLEIVVTGTNQTVITVKMHKLIETGNLIVAQNTYVDTDSPFISGTAGIGVAGSSASANAYAYLDNFTYTSTDNAGDTPKYLSHSRTVGTKTFGQVVELEKGAEYVFAAYGTVDVKDTTGYRNEPMWVEYQTGTAQTSGTYQRLITGRAAINKTCDLTKAECKENNLEYGEYNISYVTFTAGTGDTDGYVDSYIGGKVRHIVGIRLDTSTHLLGNYSYFTLYRKDDADRTNLLVNPDFKMGLYGWCDAQGLYFGFNQCEETSKASTNNGYVTLLSDKNNYEYYEMFKNPAYLCLEGDINKDQYFDVSDLVFANNMDNNYYYLADYDKNGIINEMDTAQLKIDLLNRVAAEKKVQKIARIGYRPYDSSTPPEQSIASYRLAYQMGYKILLCDVRTTKDGEFVALHDKTINSYARNSAGESIKDADPIYINDITLAEADTYDFGVYKGSQYAGTKIMRVAEFIALCKELDVTTHLELKESFTEEKLDELVELIKYYGVEDNLMINGQDADNLRYLAEKLSNAIMGTWVTGITDTLINQIATYGTSNPKFIYVSNGGEATITPENYAKCQAKGIDIAYTEIRNEEELQTFKDLGLLDYCKYVATRYDLY